MSGTRETEWYQRRKRYFWLQLNTDVLKSVEKGMLYGMRRSIVTAVESQTSGIHEKGRLLYLQKPTFS